MPVNLKKIENNYNVIRWAVFGVFTILGFICSYLKVGNPNSKLDTLLLLGCYVIADFTLFKNIETLTKSKDHGFAFTVIAACAALSLELFMTYIIASNGFSISLPDELLFWNVILYPAVFEWATIILMFIYRKMSE